jgi:hypothetical protein
MHGPGETLMADCTCTEREHIRNLEAKVATMSSEHERVMDALFNGDDGTHGLIAWMGRQDERAITEMAFHNKRDQEIKEALAKSAEKIKSDLDRRHGRRDMVQWCFMAFIALIMLLFALPTAISAWKTVKVEVPEFIHSIVSQTEYALNRAPKDAGIRSQSQ